MSDSAMPKVRKKLRMGIGVLVGASIIYAVVAQAVFPFGADEALYIGAAKSMVAGQGYRAMGRALTLYPPGWPVFLTPVALLTDGDYGWFARYTAALIPLIFCAAWSLYSVREERYRGWLIAALAASVSLFDVGTREVRSEIIFSALTIGFIAWAERTADARRTGWSAARVLVGTLLLLCAVATRTIGLALVGAVVVTGLHILVRQRTQLKAYVLRMATPVAVAVLYQTVWGRWSKAHIVEMYVGEPTTYDRWFWMRDAHNPVTGRASTLEVLERIPENIKIQASQAASLLTNLPWIAPSWTSPLVVASAVVLLAGLVEEWRRPIPLAFWYVVGYMGILSVWPFDEGTRYLIPLLPLLAQFAVSGYRALARVATQSPVLMARVVCVVAALELAAIALGRRQSQGGVGKQTLVALFVWSSCLVAGIVVQRRMTTTGAPGARRIVNYGRAAYLAGYFVFGAIGIVRIIRFNASGTLQTAGQPIHHVSDWLAANAPDSSVVMARQAASLNLTTHRKTVPFPLTTSVDVMRGAVQSLRPTFLVVVDSAWNDYYHPTEPARLALIEQALNAPLKQRARVLGAAIYEFPATSGIRVTP